MAMRPQFTVSSGRAEDQTLRLKGHCFKHRATVAHWKKQEVYGMYHIKLADAGSRLYHTKESKTTPANVRGSSNK